VGVLGAVVLLGGGAESAGGSGRVADMYPSVRVEVADERSVTVHPSGDIDYSSLEPLRQALLDARVAGVRDIIVDLTEVSFLDSQGLAVILFAHQRQRSVGGRLVLRDPSRDTLRLLHVTNLNNVIEVEETTPAG
jgi:anti-anti-sigma factor